MDFSLHSELVDEARIFLGKHETDIPHVAHVASLAFDLFVATSELHRLESYDASLLYCASLLHDIGWSISKNGAKHHKLSAQLIREFEWQKLPEQDKQIVALTARYHRKKLPTPHHNFFKNLSPKNQQKVCALASYLRVADALDRTHRQSVTILNVDKNCSQWTIFARSKNPPSKEIRVFSLKKDLFEAHFQVSLLLEFI